MDINEIYGKIFPMGVDDNNTYANLKGEELNCIQLLEPTVSVKEMIITPGERRDAYAVPDRHSYRIPLVMINDIYIEQATITNFSLDYSGFLPTVMIEFIDTRNRMLSITSLKDGSLIRVYIGGLGDEKYYKPIRQDFIVTDIKKTGGGLQNLGDDIQYRLTGKLNVPIGYKKESWSNFPCTSTQELFNLSIQTGLGFATNFEKTTNDRMKWQNMPNTDYFDFMRDITSHACYSPNTFFTSFIDQYYVLNFVECHSLLSHGGEKQDTPAIIFNNAQMIGDSIDKKGNPSFKYQEDKSENNKFNTLYNNTAQKLTYYYISNNEFFNGWTNFIEEYVEISNGGSSTSDGYRRNLGYNDYNAGDWGFNNVLFSITPIDNLERDLEKQTIKELKQEADENSYIPINLVHANQTTYQNEEGKKENNNDDVVTNDGLASSVDDISSTESFSFYGNVDTTNMYKLYYFAKEQNDYQMNCMKRCGLRIKLQNYNPSITKYSRIWVDIYDKNRSSSLAISKINVDRNNEYKKVSNESVNEMNIIHNSDILQFPNEGVIHRSFEKKTDIDYGGTINTSIGNAKYNRGLSGWYVVTELKYVFDKRNSRLNTILVLNRIEKKPIYKREYAIARNAIEKYAVDNVIEKLVKSNDDFGYASQSLEEETVGLQTIVDEAKEIVDEVVDGVKDAVEGVKEVVDEVVEGVKNVVNVVRSIF